MSHSPDIAEIAHLLQVVRDKKPLVHNLTNYVTVNDCANALLAVGAAPVMADDPDDVPDIAALANAVVINIGTLNARTIPSMFAAGKKAASLGRPVILDPVGAGATRLRTETALELIREIPLAVIRGNVSEIKSLLGESGTTRGVDANDNDLSADGWAGTTVAAKVLADRTGAIVAVHNGHPLMARITGSGCMLSAITGAFCGVSSSRMLTSVAVALCAMGLAGEQAAERTLRENAGTGSFRTYLIDRLSLMDEATLAGGMKIEQLA